MEEKKLKQFLTNLIRLLFVLHYLHLANQIFYSLFALHLIDTSKIIEEIIFMEKLEILFYKRKISIILILQTLGKFVNER